MPTAGERLVSQRATRRRWSRLRRGPGPVARARAWSTASTVRLARALVALVAAELVLGIAAVVVIPFGRPGGWVPAKGAAVYAAHASLGVVAVLGAIALLVRLRGAPHTARVVGWLGLVSLVVAGAGGLLTEARSTVRFFGMALMLLGTAFAAFAYMVPTLLSSRTTSPSAEPESLS